MTGTTGSNDDTAAKPAAQGVSPYATGGGGVTFERRAAVLYLARLLTGATAFELHGRRVQRVSFQQAPAHRVDDLVVSATRDDGTDPLELEIAVRRKPAFTKSDKDTEALFGKLLAAIRRSQPGAVEHRLAICVAGPQRAAEQVSELVTLARQQAAAVGFFSLVRTPRRFKKTLRNRLDHLVNLVTASLAATEGDATSEDARTSTWQLLGRLEILMPRLEPPTETDWLELVNQLEPWARERTLAAATALRDRLMSLADSYAPAAADIDLATLRRDTHELLDVERRRWETAWAELRRLDSSARSAMRSTLGIGQSPVHLPRPRPTSLVRKELHSSRALFVSGESGVGKSALVLSELADAAASDPAKYEVVCVNLRLLPPTIAELREALGAPLEEVLAEMSAPTRILVLDAAEVEIERDGQLLAQLLSAACTANVSPWVVAATDGGATVRAIMEERLGAVRELAISGLEDVELEEVARRFPQLRRLVDEPRAKELLRRPGIIDLFVRSGSPQLPLSDADAFKIVWTRLIRSDERRTQGLPDARDRVMRQLASQQLRNTDAVTLYESLDPAALAGLQHDALLRPADRWQPLPTFAHELLRTYALARVLLSLKDPTGELIANGAPRWALPAVRLAVQVRLAEPDNLDMPLAGRLARAQADVDRLTEAGHGDRWSDLPAEAVLTLPNSQEILADAWPTLLEREAAGLRRVLRVIQQRHGRTGIIDRLLAEPLVTLLLENGWPPGLKDQVDELLGAWLRALVVTGEPAGHALRIALRERLAARVAAGDERLAEFRREQAARLAARSPQEVAEDEARARALGSLASMSHGHSRRRWRELPRELTNDELLEQLALLGSDLGEDGELLLRRVAADAPHHLAPAVEGLLTGNGLASWTMELLIHLVEAYYIEERDDDGYDGIGNVGIRDHEYHGLGAPFSAAYYGPFLAMLRSDPRAGVACLNRLLNHAAQARVEALRHPSWHAAPESDDEYFVELDITGKRRRYYGDAQVWMWYRGTGGGPYPCMSALQALELFCDECVNAGVPLAALVRLLLHGCENLAMPALIVGMLVRHLERIDGELDSFLAEPMIWHLEFVRTIQEQSVLAAGTEVPVAPERRSWSLRNASTWLTVRAAGERCDALKVVGRRLVARAEELVGPVAEGEAPSEELAAVHGWAGSLDRDSYQFTRTEQGLLVEQVVDDQIVARLAPSSADLARGQDAFRLTYRYPERYNHIIERAPVTLDELFDDLSTARDLLNDPPAAGPNRPYDAPAAVAAAALEARFREGIDIPEEHLVWAAGLLVGLLNAIADQDVFDDDYSVFGQGPDRSAARALPLLSLPTARELRERLSAEGVDADAIARSIGWIVEHGANETRLFLARSFDPIWHAPCDTTTGVCHHVIALAVIEDFARDSLIGPWDPALRRRSRLHIDGPVAPRLETGEDGHVYVPQLSAPIRGAAAAAVSSACCRAEAATLLGAALAAHRRGMRNYKRGYFHSANDAAAAARAVLEIAATGDNSLLFAQIDEYGDNPRLLSEFLRALTAAGEETQRRATAARDVWPAVIERVVELVTSGTCPGDDHHYGRAPLDAVIPTPSNEVGYLHREYEGEAILWADPEALAPYIERWLPLAAGHSRPLDALVHLLERLPEDQQAELGLPWIDPLVESDPAQIANRSFLLPKWLERVRPYAASKSARTAWHRIVDALTVAGDARIAELAD